MIREELRKIWFGKGRDGESAKVLQLFRSIEAVRSGKLDFSGIWSPSDSRIVPVMILSNPLPQFSGLNHLYKEILRENESLNEKFIDEIKFLDIGEFEWLMFLRQQGHTLPFVFEAWKNSDLADYSLRNFLFATGWAEGRHEFTESLMKEAFQELADLVRPGERPPESGKASDSPV